MSFDIHEVYRKLNSLESWSKRINTASLMAREVFVPILAVGAVALLAKLTFPNVRLLVISRLSDKEVTWLCKGIIPTTLFFTLFPYVGLGLKKWLELQHATLSKRAQELRIIKIFEVLIPKQKNSLCFVQNLPPCHAPAEDAIDPALY